VFSDRYGLKELKRIRNRIRRRFYCPSQLLRIARKARRIGLVDGRDIIRLFLQLPFITYCLVERMVQKKRKHATARVHHSQRNKPAKAAV